ncbi:hypothetical protein HN873_051211 [Arachis hypogaea]
MRRDIFTSYIIGNRLNLKTFFEPIIDFIEIGKPKELPPGEELGTGTRRRVRNRNKEKREPLKISIIS